VLAQGAGLLVAFGLTPARAQRPPLPDPAGRTVDPGAVDAFLAIHPDGGATIHTGKVDLGQGLRIAYRQLVAEELGLPVARIDVIEGDTALTPDQGPTAGR
jgi:CO/xanthine dehydrogenase Mo-binding subunit